MSRSVANFLGGITILAVIYMLVRPGMPAATAIKDLSDALASMVRVATGTTPQQAVLT